MKKIVILSDTHNNQNLFRLALENEADVDYIFHLGDYYEDLDNNYDLTDQIEIKRVPGIYHPKYTNQTLPKALPVDIKDWKFLLVHDIKDSIKMRADREIIFYGHTHKANFYFENDKYYLNPGHLKRDMDRGFKPSYAVLKIDYKNIKIKFKYVDGTIFQNHIISHKKL